MKKIILCLLSIVCTSFALAQEHTSYGGDTLVHTENFTLQYYAGVAGTASFDVTKLNATTGLYGLRTALLTQTRFTKHFGMDLKVMGDLNNSNNFIYTQVRLFYKKERVNIYVGKLADYITTFRPTPPSFLSQYEYEGLKAISTNGLGMRIKYAFTDNFTLGASISEAGKSLGDSTRVVLRAWYKLNSIGVYVQDGTYGAALALKNKWFETKSYVNHKLWSGYAQVMVHEEFGLEVAVDWVYPFNDVAKEDYVEILFLRNIKEQYLTKRNMVGRYGIGFTNHKQLKFYCAVSF